MRLHERRRDVRTGDADATQAPPRAGYEQERAGAADGASVATRFTGGFATAIWNAISTRPRSERARQLVFRAVSRCAAVNAGSRRQEPISPLWVRRFSNSLREYSCPSDDRM